MQLSTNVLGRTMDYLKRNKKVVDVWHGLQTYWFYMDRKRGSVKLRLILAMAKSAWSWQCHFSGIYKNKRVEDIYTLLICF